MYYSDEDLSEDSYGDSYDISFTAKSKKPQTKHVISTSKQRTETTQTKSQPQRLSSTFNISDAKLPPIWISLAGHIDAGKSTLMARLFGQSTIDGLDVTPEEQAHGITMDLMVKRLILSDTHEMMLVDAPGHADFIEATSKAAALASVILFVVDSSPTQFERGLEAQIMEHLKIICCVSSGRQMHLIFVVNKMDQVQWDKERFDFVVAKLQNLVKNIWLGNPFSTSPHSVNYVPVSAIANENIFSRKNNMSQSLLEVIKSLPVISNQTPRPADNSFVITPICTTSLANSNTFLLEGHLSQGLISSSSSGKSVKVYPGGHQAKLIKVGLGESPSTQNPTTTCYKEGEYLSFALSSIDPSLVTIGSSLITSPLFSIQETKLLTCDIYIFPSSDPEDTLIILPGSKLLAITSSIAGVRANPVKIASFNPSDALQKPPRFIKCGERASVNLTLEYALLMPEASFPVRLFFRQGDRSVGIGLSTNSV